MNRTLVATLLAASALAPATARAEQPTDAVIMARLEAMQAEIARLSAEVDRLKAEAESVPAVPPQPVAVAQAMPAPVTAPTAAATPNPDSVKIAFKGGPEFSTASGWSFKPRGRLQIDAGTVSTPDGITDASTGFSSEIRRAYLGVDGKVPGGFAYRFEVEVANSAVEITDLYLTYQASKELAVTLGQIKPFFSMEDMTSDLFTTFTERAAMNNAFGFERRLGISAVWAKGPWTAQGGVFTDNVADLNNDENNSLSFDGRLVFAPVISGTQLHLGASAHLRELNNAGSTVRYRVRPLIHSADIRFVDTGTITADSELGYGVEAALISGRFHAAGEMHWQQVNNPVAAVDPTFFGGYAEAGLFLTDDSRTYRAGVFDRVRPSSPLDKGGMGALELNLRYDYLDLTDGGITGGQQAGYMASLVWTPTDYTRFLLNYARLQYDNAALAGTGGDRSYAVDAVGLRAQMDF